LNGAKSRGPVTAEGKFISSQNNLRHGLLAKTIVMKGESHGVFCDFIRSLEEAFQPQGAIENALIEKMALCQWRQMRLMGIERAGMHYKIAQQEQAQARARQSGGESGDAGLVPCEPATSAFIAFTDLADHSRCLELMNRYEARADRHYDRAYTRLLDLQERRGKKNWSL